MTEREALASILYTLGCLSSGQLERVAGIVTTLAATNVLHRVAFAMHPEDEDEDSA